MSSPVITRPCAALLAAAILLGGCTNDPGETGANPTPSKNPASRTPKTKSSVATGRTVRSPLSSPTPAPAPTRGQPLASRAIRPAGPGRYVFDNRGSETFDCGVPRKEPVPDVSRITVDPPIGDRQKIVVDTRDSSGEGEIATSVLEFTSDGIYLAFLRLEQSTPLGSDIDEFNPARPVLVMPAQPVAGQAWGFTLESSDRELTIKVSNRVEDAADAVSLGNGASVTATRIVSTARARGQSALGTVAQTVKSKTWVSLDHRLIVRDISDTSGTVGTCRTTGHIDSRLRSAQT